eukprot:9424900-Alexandrium_andersonii.AAC.1
MELGAAGRAPAVTRPPELLTQTILSLLPCLELAGSPGAECAQGGSLWAEHSCQQLGAAGVRLK